MWFYFLVFLMIVVSYLMALNSRLKVHAYYFVGVALVIIAGLRPSGVDGDMNTYSEYYQLLPKISIIQVEPTFQLIGYLVKLYWGQITLLFLVYAALGVCIKLYAIQKLTKLYFLSLLIYFSYYFLLHEMTQIRAGVAAAFLFLSIPEIYSRNWKNFLIKVTVGCLFHYSLMLFIPFYFLKPNRINVVFYSFIIFSGYIAYFSGIHLVNLFKLMPIPLISSKIETYQMLLTQNIHSAIDIFNVVFLCRVCLCLLLLSKWKLLMARNKYSIVLIKIYCFSIFFFVALADLPVLAARINQLLAVVEIVLIPFLAYIFKPRLFALLLIIIVSAGLLSIKLLYGGLLNPYFSGVKF